MVALALDMQVRIAQVEIRPAQLLVGRQAGPVQQKESGGVEGKCQLDRHLA